MIFDSCYPNPRAIFRDRSSPPRRLLFRAAALALLTVAAPAAATSYPERPVKLIVPFPPGGATDVIARVYSERLAQKFGQQFFVENKPGAGGTIGADATTKAPNDGYTLLVYHIGIVATPHLSKVNYDPIKDLSHITLLGVAPALVAVNKDLPASTLKALIQLGRDKPNQITYGISGIGGSDHLAAEMLQSVTKTKFKLIPYRGGGPAVTAAISGEVQFVIQSVPTIVGQIKAGQLRALAVTSKERVSSVPDVPTTAEAGVPEFDQSSWFALWGPPNMPADVVTKLNDAIREIAAEEGTKAALDNVGVQPVTNTPAEFSAMMQSEYQTWGRILREAGLAK